MTNSNKTEQQVSTMEQDGGNLYRPHKFMVNSGQFWRCKHGKTGFEVGLNWNGCDECKKDDPEAHTAWIAMQTV